MMGYADEYETIALELTYNYGRTEYNKGNAYAQVSPRLHSLLYPHPTLHHRFHFLNMDVTYVSDCNQY